MLFSLPHLLFLVDLVDRKLSYTHACVPHACVCRMSGPAQNAQAARVAKRHCAHFLGHCYVTEEEATPRITQGLWLVSSTPGSSCIQQHSMHGPGQEGPPQLSGQGGQCVGRVIKAGE